MPTPTYDLIASSVLGSTATEVIFSSISASYRDLVLVVDAQMASNNYVNIRFNGDTGGNYPNVSMQGDGTTATSTSFATETAIWVNNISPGSTRVLGILNIMDYSVTDKHKTILVRGTTPAVETRARASRWANTAAINAIRIYNFGAVNFNAGSTFYLYGIVS